MVAMVTDRDLVARVVAASRDPSTVRCEEIATKDLGWILMRGLGMVAVLLRHGQTLLPPDDRPTRCSAVAGVAVITAVAAGVGGIAVAV